MLTISRPFASTSLIVEMRTVVTPHARTCQHIFPFPSLSPQFSIRLCTPLLTIFVRVRTTLLISIISTFNFIITLLVRHVFHPSKPPRKRVAPKLPCNPQVDDKGPEKLSRYPFQTADKAVSKYTVEDTLQQLFLDEAEWVRVYTNVCLFLCFVSLQ